MSREEIEARIRATPIEGDVDAMRAGFASLVDPRAEGRAEDLAGRRALVFGDGPPVIWLHGGGYVFGAPETHANAADFLAKAAKCQVWLPAYRLAPDAVWPAPLEDALSFLHAFPCPVALIGDSAGAHLALTVARHLPENVTRLALISPNTDRTGQSDTRRRNGVSDLMNDDETDTMLWRMAMPDMPVDDPDASPVLADLSGLPPVYLTATTDEVLFDDTRLLLRALEQHDVRHQADIVPGLFHMWTLWPDHLSEARQSLRRIAAFLREAD